MSAHIENTLKRTAQAAAVAAIGIAVAAMAGWSLDLPQLRSWVAGAVSMRPNAAVCALLLGAGLLLLSREWRSPWPRRLAQALVLLVAALAALTLLQYLQDWDAGIDRLWFGQALAALGPRAGRMAAAASLEYLLLAAALRLAASQRPWSQGAGQVAALAAAAAATLSLLGYTFRVEVLYTLSPWTAQSLPSALACFLLGLGTLLAWPERGGMRVLASEQAGGRLLRRALPLMVGFTWLACWLSVAGARAGFYSEDVDQVFVALPLMLLFCGFLFLTARALNRAGERQEAQRLEVERLNQELEERVQQRTAQLITTDHVARQREHLLQRSEERYRSLVTATAQVVWTTDSQGLVEDMPMWRELTGQTVEQVRGWGWLEAIHPEDRERTAQAWAAAVEGRSPYDVEYRVRRRDGEWRYLAARGVPVLEPDGNIREWVGICTDITESKRAEEQLRAAALYNRSLIEASVDPLVTIGKEGKIMDANRATELATGVGREKLIGSDFSNYFTEPEKAQEGYQQVFAQGLVQDYPLAIRHASGRVTEVLYNATVFKNEAGEVEGVFAAARDITARQRAEREAQRLNRALRTLSECNEAMVRAGDEEALLRQVCELAVRVGGYRMAWVGYAQQNENKAVRPVAQAGVEEGYLSMANITWADVELGRGPTGTAIRSGEPLVCQDVATCPCMHPWRELALSHGFRSCVALPLKAEERPFGALCIYAVEVGAFDAQELQLLKELASDLSYGIQTLRTRAEREHTAGELRRREWEQSIRARLTQTFLTSRDEEMYADELEVILEAMHSPLGVFGYIDENGDSVIPSMTRGVWSQCQVPEKSIRFPRSGWGDAIWCRALREKKTLYSNASSHVPEGHLPIRRNISLPILFQGEAIGLLQVANKDSDYTDGDIAFVESLAEHIAPILSARLQRDRQEHKRRQAEEEVRRMNAELEERVRQRTAELEQSNRELESFTYSVSHDLRAPLRHVDGFSKILLEEYGAGLDETGRGYLERVRHGTQFMGRLVDDLLNLSRVGRQPLAVQITGLGTLLEDARQELATETEGRAVEWRIGPLPFVECDPGLMKQVLANLLSNALKFTRPRARAVIEVGEAQADGGRVVYVRDNGVGFNMKYADKLFGIFQRLHRQEDFEGTGVGLATVERILHKHGGRIWAEAELDKGATFYFTLGPTEVSAEPPAKNREVAA